MCRVLAEFRRKIAQIHRIVQCEVLAVPFEHPCYNRFVLQESKSGDRCFAFQI